MADAQRFHATVWQEETQHLALWKRYLDKTEQDALRALRKSDDAVRAGQYEDQDAFIPHSEREQKRRRLAAASKMRETLQNKPYYGRVDIMNAHAQYALRFFISDNPNLDTVMHNADSHHMLIPFIRNGKFPLCEKIIDCYMLKDASAIRQQSISRDGEPSQTDEYQVLTIREVAIKAGQLENTQQYYPELSDQQEPIDADDLLARRLEKERSVGGLSNIISTIQRRQFAVIRKEPNASFVLQGCAGSGKTQIMIHRLFYLRGQFGAIGWENVVILTPSYLFNDFTANLIAQYKLSQALQLTITEYYRVLLNAYDKRFNTRRYVFEMTEEYLPDAYLQKAYEPDNIARVVAAMRNAIRTRLEEGSRLTQIPLPERRNARETINAMIASLSERIRAYGEKDNAQGDDAQKSHIEAIETLRKGIATLQRAHQKASVSLAEFQAHMEVVKSRETELDKAKEEAKAWEQRCASELTRTKQAYTQAYNHLRKAPSQTSLLPYLMAYVDAEFALSMLTVNDSPVKQQKDEIKAFYSEAVLIYEKDLADALGGVTLQAWKKRAETREQTLVKRIQAIEERIQDNIAQISDHEAWLERYAREQGHERVEQWHANRSEMERVRYRLERIESSVFEQEVWNVISALKDAHDIKTTLTQEHDGRRQTTRILYKIDLILYLRIYLELYGVENLPRRQLLCIDEGQDLHAADYLLLRELHPNVPVNLFGDLAQGLHTGCGVREWRADTGIEDVVEMDNNYRNPQEIVKFCLERFGGSMRSVGICGGTVTVLSQTDVSAIRKVALSGGKLHVIVRDRQSFDILRAALGAIPRRLCYLDMSSQKPEPDALEVYSVYASKGLEFPNVMVVSRGMSANQKLVACTRATQNLIYIEEE